MGAYDFRTVPPPLTQTEFNSERTALKAALDGFTPSGTFKSPYSFLVVYNISTSVYDVCNAFQVLYSNADASTAVQWALDNLSGGRTWKEVIMIVGDLGNVYGITVPPYTKIMGQDAFLTLPANQASVFTLTGGHDIEICGLNFTAADNRTVDSQAITATDTGTGAPTAYNVFVHDNNFTNFISDYISDPPTGIFGNYNNLKVKNNTFTSTSGVGSNSYSVHITGGNNIKILHNDFTNNFAGNCVYIRNFTTLKINSNHFAQTADWATAPVEAVDLEGASTHAVVTGNTFDTLSVEGVYLAQSNTYGNLTDVVISGNSFYRCGYLNAAKRGGVSAAGNVAVTLSDIMIGNNNFESCNVALTIGQYSITGQAIHGLNFSGNNVMNGDIGIYIWPITAYSRIVVANNNFKNTDPPIFYNSAVLPFRSCGNTGFVTEVYGTVDLGGVASVTITPNLSVNTLVDNQVVIMVTLIAEGNDISAIHAWIDNIAAATFDIIKNGNPATACFAAYSVKLDTSITPNAAYSYPERDS